MKWQDMLALGQPTLEEGGALLTVSSHGLALGKRLAEGAFHLPGAHGYSPASGFVPGQGGCLL